MLDGFFDSESTKREKSKERIAEIEKEKSIKVARANAISKHIPIIAGTIIFCVVAICITVLIKVGL